MNKEQLRKELEDVITKAYRAGYFRIGFDNKAYVDSRLAALDDGPDLVELQKKFDEALTQESVDEYIKEHPELFNKKDSVDDGQEGKGLDIEKMIKFLDELPIETGEQFFLLKAIKQKLHEAALPVADGEGEKAGAYESVLEKAITNPKELTKEERNINLNHKEIMRYFNDEYHIKKMTEPEEDKGPI